MTQAQIHAESNRTILRPASPIVLRDVAHDDSRHDVYTSRLPFDERRVGAAAVYCSDGRFGEQMDEFLHDGLGLPRYDRVAVPGGAACLAGHPRAAFERAALERQLNFLIAAHELTRVVFIAHHDCGFYKQINLRGRSLPEQQATDLARAAARLGSENPHVRIESYLATREDGRVRFVAWPVSAGAAGRSA